jgi:hypothetical protein
MAKGRSTIQVEAEGPPYVIGWKEYVDFPEWGIEKLKVKVDTGARTSAIHVSDMELYEADGRLMVKMDVALDRGDRARHVIVHAPVVRTVVVTSSSGQRETRPVVETLMRLGPITKRVQLTATNRQSMLFRMLLGRKAVEGDFVVDVCQAYRMKKR